MPIGIKFRNKKNQPVYPCPYFPVGSIYMTTVDVNPKEYFGGTWSKIENRFLLGASSTYKPNATGGEATHTLTTAEMPAHSHTAGSYDGYVIDNTGFASGGSGQCVRANTATKSSSTRIKTNNTGSGSAHNNMPPYWAVYIWRRTA